MNTDKNAYPASASALLGLGGLLLVLGVVALSLDSTVLVLVVMGAAAAVCLASVVIGRSRRPAPVEEEHPPASR